MKTRLKIAALMFQCLLKCTLSQANSVNVLIVNNSNFSIYGLNSEVHNGSFLVSDNGKVSPAEVKKGGTAAFSTSQAAIFCGTDGYVFYKAIVNGKQYEFSVHFNVPFAGDNEFYFTADAPFKMRHIVGGPGSNVTISFELTGGPAEVDPPAPPVNLQTTGSAWISGQITWNASFAGMPDGMLANAFDFEVIAPSKFYPNYPENKNPSFTGGTISANSGSFTDFKSLANVKVQVKKEERKSANDRMAQTINSMVVTYTISNLPNAIPLEVIVKPKFSFWTTGNNTPPKPERYPQSKWSVFATKTKQGDGFSNFNITGVWMDAQGKVVSDMTGTTALEKQLLNKQITVIKKDILVSGDDIYKIPGVDRSRLQLSNQTPSVKSIQATKPIQATRPVNKRVPLNAPKQ